MNQVEPEIASASVVLLGAFNPPIFQPAWFALQELLPRPVADSAEVNIVHPQVVSFEADWLEVQATRDRLSFTTAQDPFDQLRDLALGVLAILRHTPVRAMGLNREAHFRMQTEDAWHEVGNRLAPKEYWTMLLEPGTENLTIRALRPDDYKGVVRVIVEPSPRVPNGVYVQVNDHYEWSVPTGETALSNAVEVLEKEWEKSRKRASDITESVIGGEHADR